MNARVPDAAETVITLSPGTEAQQLVKNEEDAQKLRVALDHLVQSTISPRPS